MDVREAVASRYSCRAFLPNAVPEATVHEIVERAARAPSGGNLQAWRVYAIAGARVEALKALLAPRRGELPKGEGGEYQIFPTDLKEPYRTRRFAVGEQLYRSIGVAREEFRVLWRAGRPVFRHRPRHAAGAMGRSRWLHPDRHGARPGLWPAHLPARGLDHLAAHHARFPKTPAETDAVLRHGARLCRYRSADQFLALAPGTARFVCNIRGICGLAALNRPFRQGSVRGAQDRPCALPADSPLRH
jgi:nitroreductase